MLKKIIAPLLLPRLVCAALARPVELVAPGPTQPSAFYSDVPQSRLRLYAEAFACLARINWLLSDAERRHRAAAA